MAAATLTRRRRRRRRTAIFIPQEACLPALRVPAREARPRWNATVSPPSSRAQREEKKSDRGKSRRNTFCCLPSLEGGDRGGCQTLWVLLRNPCPDSNRTAVLWDTQDRNQWHFMLGSTPLGHTHHIPEIEGSAH